MTTNQLQYWANQEIIRSNLEREKENNRGNVAKEQENYRSNVAREQLQSDANRISRANKVDELDLRRVIETEANAIKWQSNVNQYQANRIAARKVQNELQLGKTLNDIKLKQHQSQAALNKANIAYTSVKTGNELVNTAANFLDAIIPG